MYKVLEKPLEEIQTGMGVTYTPIVSLADEHGGEVSIVMDDGCYLLALQGNPTVYKIVTHWFPEAVEALFEYIHDATINAVPMTNTKQIAGEVWRLATDLRVQAVALDSDAKATGETSNELLEDMIDRSRPE